MDVSPTAVDKSLDLFIQITKHYMHSAAGAMREIK